MSKYDVYINSEGVGLLLDVQADLLESLNTRIIVPLMLHSSTPNPAKGLNPIFEIDGESYVMVSQFMAAVPVGILKKKVGNLEHQFSNITGALDLLLTGF
jgi:toxin CcdB